MPDYMNIHRTERIKLDRSSYIYDGPFGLFVSIYPPYKWPVDYKLCFIIKPKKK